MSSSDFQAAADAAAASQQLVPALVTPPYWDEACKHLAKRDRVMRKLVADYGQGRLYSRRDAFTTLARSIVGQQISQKSAQLVWERLLTLVGQQPPQSRAPLSVQAVLAMGADQLRTAGLSARKTEYLKDLAEHFAEGRVHVNHWERMDDETIIEELVDIRGISRWTAEMFLIFHLMRPNVLPLDDAILIQAISQSYFSGEPVSRAEARDIAEAWAPYRTVGTWYLWRSLDPLPAAS
ncbi:DNA-3-methyladenine glycosylase family protein [Aquabacterium sp.]|uniref:DNA-3-methyladenine glycosylase family protein n=1 Tax=Aquabacterium sp. TaxID=1872578 RepID=UPI003D6D6BD7